MRDDAAIAELVEGLGDDDTNRAQDAQLALESYGARALPQLLAATLSLDRFGQLCAIELLEGIGDRRAAAVLIPLLGSEHDTVREWAAAALGALGADEAVPDLQRAYERAKTRGIPLEWTEPVAYRRALTQLGARRPVLPPPAEALRADTAGGPRWRPCDLPAVLDALAEARQIVLYFQYWTRGRWTETPGWEVDWTLPWAELVELAHSLARAAALAAGAPDETVVTVEWIDESDR
jgi:hypothetical protein